MPSAILASKEDVSRKYSSTPFFLLQKGGTDFKSMGD
jgi:hypothetical protein